MSYYFGIPMFSDWGSAYAGARIQANTAAATAAAWPYGWASYSSGVPYYGMIDPETPYNEAIEINKMLHNPNYIPYIDVSSAGGGSYADMSQIQQMGSNAAYRDLLKIKYSCLGNDINSFINEVNTALEAEGITPEQKQKLEEFKQRAEAIKKEHEEFAEKSKNMDAQAAFKELKKLEQKNDALVKEAKEFNAAQAQNNQGVEGNQNADNNNSQASNLSEIDEDEEITPEQLQTKYKNELKPAIKELLKNENLDEEDKQAIQEKKKELEKAIEEGKPIEELREKYNELVNLVTQTNNKIARGETSQKYEDELKPAIEEVLNNPNLSEEDKAAIEAKQKELEKAIEDGKSPDKINKIYDDLNTLINKTKEKLTAEETQKTEQAYESLKTQTAELCNDFNKWMTEGDYEAYISDKDKETIRAKGAELLKAIEEKKPNEEIQKLYNEYKACLDAVKPKTEKLKEETSKIAGDIYEAATGPDFHIVTPWSSFTEKEQTIINSVKKLNKDNVIAFLITWENRYRSSDGHSCIIDTIRSEFLEYDNAATETELTNHILAAIEQYAKENKLSSKIFDKIRIIKGNMAGATGDWGKVYTEFNNLLELLKVRPPSETKPQ